MTAVTGTAHPAVVRQPPDGQQRAQHRRRHHGDGGHLQRVDQARCRSAWGTPLFGSNSTAHRAGSSCPLEPSRHSARPISASTTRPPRTSRSAGAGGRAVRGRRTGPSRWSSQDRRPSLDDADQPGRRQGDDQVARPRSARKTASSWSAFWLPSRSSAAASSVTAKPAAIEVFFASAIQTLPSGGTTVRNGLREHDAAQRLPEVEAEGPGRLGLARRHRVDARAQRLGDERRGVERQARATAVMNRVGNCRSISRMPEREEEEDHGQRGVAGRSRRRRWPPPAAAARGSPASPSAACRARGRRCRLTHRQRQRGQEGVPQQREVVGQEGHVTPSRSGGAGGRTAPAPTRRAVSSG